MRYRVLTRTKPGFKITVHRRKDGAANALWAAIYKALEANGQLATPHAWRLRDIVANWEQNAASIDSLRLDVTPYCTVSIRQGEIL